MPLDVKLKILSQLLH